MMYKIIYQQVPIKSMFTNASNVHRYNTRQYNQCHISKYKLKLKDHHLKLLVQRYGIASN